ncbi:MAG: hypothetical protein JWP01_1985 [Myxococcales bacterium]|nr:hypothetical protein [Myxococcales bacterium]
MRTFITTLTLLYLGSIAHAETGNDAPEADGYCDYVEGVAGAQSATLFAPTVFGQFGLIEQAAGTVNPDTQSGGLRLITGVRVSLDGIYKGLATRDRARADCRRHTALERVRGETVYAALDARAQVLDKALTDAEKILAQTSSDLDARRTTAQEATATRLRVEELRQIATQTRREMSLLPRPSGPLGGALGAFQRADDDVERIEGKLRRASAFDVSVRVGLDSFLDRSNPSPYFAVVAVGINLGTLWQGAANARAAAGRQRLVRSGRDPVAADASADRVRALIEAETQRAEEVSALEGDLAKQLQTLERLGGEDSKRYRQTVWFEWIKIKAEQAYLTTHLRALRDILGGVEP